MPIFFRACRHHSTKSAKWGGGIWHRLSRCHPLSASGGNCPPAPPPMVTYWSNGIDSSSCIACLVTQLFAMSQSTWQNDVVFVGGGKPGNFLLTGSDLPSHWFVWKLRGMERGRGGKGKGGGDHLPYSPPLASASNTTLVITDSDSYINNYKIPTVLQ